MPSDGSSSSSSSGIADQRPADGKLLLLPAAHGSGCLVARSARIGKNS